MEEYLDAHAPQWVDFTKSCSPQVAQDFFDKVRTIERKEEFCDFTSKDMENIQPASQDVSNSDTITKLQEDLIMKNTPVKMISPNRDNKEKVTTITYDQILSNAMRTLEFCKKPPKNRDASNKINQESNVFKTPNVSKITKSSRSTGFRSVPHKHVQSSQDNVSKSTKINKNNNTVNMRRTLANHYLFKQDDACVKNNASKIPDVRSDDTKDKKRDKEDNEELKEKNNKELNEENNEECKEENNEEREKESNDEFKNENEDHNEENNKEQQEQEEPIDDNKNKEENDQDDVDTAIGKTKQRQSNKHTSILTWQNHRRSMYKRRTSTNKQYVSLAEAVSRFQNETPKRFRTRSTKENNTSASISLPKLMQNRLRTTVPVSPALISKNRTRAVTVLSQEEREKLELEEMKKHKIKAKPIPPSVLRGPRVMPKVVKKSADTCSTTQPESNDVSCATSLLQSKNSPPPACHDKTLFDSKKTVPRITVTDSEGIIVEHQTIAFYGVPKENSVTKSATRVQPFSFEARNKDLQMKKEQRLKSLQEANKTKIEFHAKPVPNFSKPPTPSAKQQQQQSMKRPVLPCPFSFEERNKQLSKKKEQLVKQVLEEDKRSRIFRANPVPFFKPVMVRGRSKDRLFMQDKKVANEHEDQENLEPNVGSSKTENKNNRKSAACAIDKRKTSLKEKIHPPELNTDKRAKERREFEERLKRKEMEEEAKRQEQNKKQLEEEKQIKVELRKLTEVKARPMPKYKLPVIVKATKQLTQPQSPAFASKLKSKQT